MLNFVIGSIMLTKIQKWFQDLYKELLAVNESPHRVGLSFAIGVFLGILPFTGVIAAIAVAVFFRLIPACNERLLLRAH